MEAHNPYINHLFQLYLEGNYSEEDLDTLLAYFKLDEDSEQLRELIEQQFEKPIPESIDQEEVSSSVARIGKELEQKINHPQKAKPFKWWYAAASIFLISTIATISYLYIMDTKSDTVFTSQYGNDVLPGKDQATLTLSNGETIVLSDSKDGIVIDNTAIRYSDGSEIAAGKSDIQYAVLSTPRKGQYQIRLPDGSKVWLNAESSLRYPNTFTGSERRVELKGEAYFEVAHNTEQPFIIETESQHLKVLGTSFNLNAYSNEPSTVTTLVTGSIEVGSKKSKTVKRIKPAQQAILESNSFRIEPVDVRPFVAWKEGEFRFKDTPLHEALRQIERWYDIEVDYDNIPKDIEIYAFIRRDKKLSSVLFALEKITDLKFTIRERRLMLME